MGEKRRHRAGQVSSGTRREVLQFAGSVALGGVLPSLAVRPAAATPATMQSAIAAVIGDAKLNAGRVKLEIPPLVENGNTVACAVVVESPMSASDYVKAIHVFNEKNPQPNVISVKLGPRAGRAAIATRIRLSDTQTVTAIAEMSDGSFWSHAVDVVITLGACLEDPL
ncbi:MAG TPA: SoxY-related AACIE arm protein [Hyphomicrobiaceae bacterium]|jgi:sulfur-oxidizing protein SoxY|nr:SoxY-related AACIE arm protein [Hyphomicrobiaceae bacterium]